MRPTCQSCGKMRPPRACAVWVTRRQPSTCSSVQVEGPVQPLIQRGLSQRAIATSGKAPEIDKAEVHRLVDLVRIAHGEIYNGQMRLDSPDLPGGMRVGRGSPQRATHKAGVATSRGAAQRERGRLYAGRDGTGANAGEKTRVCHAKFRCRSRFRHTRNSPKSRLRRVVDFHMTGSPGWASIGTRRAGDAATRRLNRSYACYSRTLGSRAVDLNQWVGEERIQYESASADRARGNDCVPEVKT